MVTLLEIKCEGSPWVLGSGFPEGQAWPGSMSWKILLLPGEVRSCREGSSSLSAFFSLRTLQSPGETKALHDFIFA